MDLVLSYHNPDMFKVSWDEKDPKVESKLRELGGAWEDFNSFRFSPATRHILKALNQNLPDLKIKDQKTLEHVQELISTTRTAKELSKGSADAAIPPKLAEEYPETAQALRPYQRAAVEFLVMNESTLLADSPGLGKTISTISALIADDTVEGDILVLSPSIATQVVWPAELNRWAQEEEVIKATGTKAQRDAALALLDSPRKGKRRWVLCNVEMVRTIYHKASANPETGEMTRQRYEEKYPQLFDREWSAIVLDEAHRFLVTNKSQRYKQSQTRSGLSGLELKKGGKKIAMTGTPFRGKLENLWGTLNWLYPKKYSAYHSWIDRWFPTVQGFFGGKEIQEIEKRNITPFFESISPFTLRRTKAEVAEDLPPKTYTGNVPEGVDTRGIGVEGMIGHWLEMAPKQRKAYREMEEMAMSRLEDGVLVANGVLAELTRLKQFAGTYGELYVDKDGKDRFRPSIPSNKFDWLLEFLESLGIMKGSVATGPESQKVVVVSQFTSVLDVFSRELNKKGIANVQITGKVSGANRKAAAEEFQSDSGPQVMLLNTHAGGVALTLDRADDIVILDETFIPDDQEQVEDRVHRISRNHKVFVHYVRSLGTIEESIARTTFKRDSIQKEVLDGERGIEFARTILSSS